MSNSDNTNNEYDDVREPSGMSRILALGRNAFRSKDRNRLIITQIINAILGLISGKLIAMYITPSEFGKFNIQFAAFSFFSGIFIAPLLQFKKTAYKDYFGEYGYGNFFKAVALNSFFLALVMIAFFTFYSNGEFMSFWFMGLVLIYIPLYYFNGFMADQFNILGKLKLFAQQSIVNNLTGALFIALMCLFFSVNGSLTLWTMQIMLVVLGLLIFSRKIVRYQPLKRERFIVFWKKQMKFTIPLIILAFFTWINNYFDRYIIEANLGLDEVGIYNVNYGLGSKFFLMLSPIFLVLLTPYVFQTNSIEFKKNMIAKYAKVYFGFGLILVAIIFLTNRFIGELLLSEQYESGFYIIYSTALCTLILTGTYLFETLLYVEHRTRTILFSNITAAVISVGLNLILVPSFGMTGAVLSALFASLARLIYTFIVYVRL